MSQDWNEMSEAQRQSECEIKVARSACEWTENGEDCFDTACRKNFEFSDGGVADNGFEFCPFCGGHIALQNEPDS